MGSNVRWCWAVGLLAGAVLVGCTNQEDKSGKKMSKEEEAVKTAFGDLQAGLEAVDDGNTDKLWAAIDKETQKEAEATAKAVKEAYDKADKMKKEEMNKTWVGKKKVDLATLDTKSYFKTERFHDKFHKVEDSTVTKVQVDGNKATVHYKEKEGDTKQMKMSLEDKEWKAQLELPR